MYKHACIAGLVIASSALVIADMPTFQGGQLPQLGTVASEIGDCTNGTTPTTRKTCRPDGNSPYSLGQNCKTDLSNNITVSIGVVSITRSYPNGCDNSVPKSVGLCASMTDVLPGTTKGDDVVVESGSCGSTSESKCVNNPKVKSLFDYFQNLVNQKDPSLMSYLESKGISAAQFLAKVSKSIVYNDCGPSDDPNLTNSLSCPGLNEDPPKALHTAKECSN